MTIRKLAKQLTMTAALFLVLSTAHAKAPLAVDCSTLEGALIGVDSVIPGGTFDNLGDLVSQAKKDPALFATLSGLIFSFSGGAINFTDPRSVVPTAASCGLTPLLVTLVND